MASASRTPATSASRHMAERKNTHGLTVRRHRRATVIDIGDMEIWDGADLSLIRDTLNRLIIKERRRSIAIQMQTVKYVPSGFFGMLYDWFERGITVRLVAPQQRVTQMLWFQRFFDHEQGDCYILRENRRQSLASAEEAEADKQLDPPHFTTDGPHSLSTAQL